MVYHNFGHLDNFIKGTVLTYQTDAETAFSDFITFRSSDFYREGIFDLVEHWLKCEDPGGPYFV